MNRAIRLPGGMTMGESRLLLLGNRELTVEGCKGILEYEPEQIRLNLGTGSLTIRGSELTLLSLEPDYAQVGGRFASVEFQ